MLGGWKCPYSVGKIARLSDGSIVAICGSLVDFQQFITWLESDRAADQPDLADSSIILLHPDRSGTVYENKGYFTITPEFAAWGSGAIAANAALYMGADAHKAVEIAALLDDSTGGAIVSMNLKD